MRVLMLEGKRGSAAILMIAAVPLCCAMLMLLVECGRIALARTRLQSAADRAAVAGASSLAESLDRVARENWGIHRAWRDLAKDFAADAQQDRHAAAQRYSQYEAQCDAALGQIGSTLDRAGERAREASANTLWRNAPEAAQDIAVRNAVSLSADADPERQWGTVPYGSIAGAIFTDPESVEGGEYRALKYLIKRPGPDAAVGVVARQRVRPALLGAMLGAGVEIEAAAAAQAFGGSMEAFAMRETETADEAAMAVDEGGRDGLYRAALVPVWTLGGVFSGKRH